MVRFSRDFTFRINILNSISTPHKHSFFIITNGLSVSRDLPHPFLAFYFNPNLHHFINNTCNSIHFLSMTIDTKFMELIGVFLNCLRFVNYNVFVKRETGTRKKYLIMTKEWIISQIPH